MEGQQMGTGCARGCGFYSQVQSQPLMAWECHLDIPKVEPWKGWVGKEEGDAESKW
jgi:hypothetical protein